LAAFAVSSPKQAPIDARGSEPHAAQQAGLHAPHDLDASASINDLCTAAGRETDGLFLQGR
jgi:hypothetical protein